MEKNTRENKKRTKINIIKKKQTNKQVNISCLTVEQALPCVISKPIRPCLIRQNLTNH